jgi:syntaxin 1B/2/3
VLGNVRARHNDMLKIEKSIIELLDLLDLLNQQIVQQAPVIQEIATKAEDTTQHLDQANVHINKGIRSALSRRKYKWLCFGVVVLICIVIAVGVGVGVSMSRGSTNANK